MSEADVGEWDRRAGAALLRAEGDGAGRQALDLIGRMVAAIGQTPMVAVRSADRSGTVRFWNHTCARLYGLAAAQALASRSTSCCGRPSAPTTTRRPSSASGRTASPAPRATG